MSSSNHQNEYNFYYHNSFGRNEGLVHISKLDTKRVERVEDVVAVGDAIVVKVTDIDQQGRINLSRRDAILALEAKRAEQQAQQQ